MTDIIKTWPANMDAKVVAKLFSEDDAPFCELYFTLGRGMPKQKVDYLWFTYQGRIIGRFKIDRIVVNDGTLPRLSRIDGGESEWQIRKDAKVAICAPPCIRLKERIFMSGFRGWRYFDLESYRETSESRHRL
jgi:hypothetical protein